MEKFRTSRRCDIVSWRPLPLQTANISGQGHRWDHRDCDVEGDGSFGERISGRWSTTTVSCGQEPPILGVQLQAGHFLWTLWRFAVVCRHMYHGTSEEYWNSLPWELNEEFIVYNAELLSTSLVSFRGWWQLMIETWRISDMNVTMSVFVLLWQV